MKAELKQGVAKVFVFVAGTLAWVFFLSPGDAALTFFLGGVFGTAIFLWPAIPSDPSPSTEGK